jgi:hypothetical protein
MQAKRGGAKLSGQLHQLDSRRIPVYGHRMTQRLPLTLVITLASLAVVAAVAPGPPQNLEASVNGTTVAFTWQAPSIGGVPTEYVLDASYSPSGPEIASFGVTGTKATVLDVPDGIYYVRVHALNADGESAASNEVVVAVPAGGGCTSAPNPPEALMGSATGSLVTVSWSAPSAGCDATSYSVQAGSSPGASDVAEMNVDTATTLSASAPAGIYYIRVVAVNAFGGSVPSDEVTVTVGCPSAPHTPTNLTGGSVGNLVSLTWTAAGTGCAATRYTVQAGSASGLSDLASLDVAAGTSLSVSAPLGTYYVRVLATNDFGGSSASNEVVLTVTASSSFNLGFSGLAGMANGAPVSSYTESGFTVTTTAEEWSATTTYGNPAPFTQFLRQANEASLTGELTVTSGGALFRFTRVDVYSSVTPIPVELVGLRNGVAVFTVSGTVPNTFGNFATVSNPQPTAIIDTLRIRVTNPATACCSNPVGVDNIGLVR